MVVRIRRETARQRNTRTDSRFNLGFGGSIDGFIANEFSTMFTRYSSRLNRMRENRDIDKECGYPIAMDAIAYKQWYLKEPIAQRVVTIYPEECWALDPEIYETPDPDVVTPFETALKKLYRRHNVTSNLERLDLKSGIGRFGILLMGFDDGKELSQPVQEIERGIDNYQEPKKVKKLLFLRVFDESLVKVAAVENRPYNPRYGRPVLYDINFAQVDDSVSPAITGGHIPSQMAKVHWTRVIHFSESEEVYGSSRLEVCINRIFDVRKVSGGSAEMFWQGAFPGISFETNPNLLMDAEIDQESLRAEMKRYSEGLQRYLAIVGVSAKSLAPQVADPRHHVDVQLLLIAMAIRTPLRILMGSEEARLASSQDMLTWNKRLRRRQQKVINPYIMDPFNHAMMMTGNLPFVEDFTNDWPDLNTPTDSDRADIAMKMSAAIVQYVTGNGAAVVPPLHFLTLVLGFDVATAKIILKETGMDMKKLLAITEKMNAPSKNGIGGSNPKETNVGGV